MLEEYYRKQCVSVILSLMKVVSSTDQGGKTLSYFNFCIIFKGHTKLLNTYVSLTSK